MLWRHLFAVLALPTVVTVVLPVWLTRISGGVDSRWSSENAIEISARMFGAALFVVAFLLFAWCLTLFARVGRGTLAPWDPTRQLVVVGPYRHVRNPMITAVAGMLAAEAVFVGSRILAAWALLFVLVNHAYLVLSEERGLERRFGVHYRDYRRSVPRWLPRRRRDGDR